MTSIITELPADPLVVTFRYAIRNTKNNRMFRLGVGWLPANATNFDMCESENMLKQMYEANLGAKPFRELLEVSQIVKLRVSTTYESAHMFPKSLKDQLDRKIDVINIQESKAPDRIKSLFVDYHMRGGEKKSTYHYAFQFPGRAAAKWLSSKDKAFRKEYFGAEWYWVSADYYGMEYLIKAMAKNLGYKFPQVRASNDVLMFKNKTDAMVFRLASELPTTFYDFTIIHSEFITTKKLNLVPSA